MDGNATHDIPPSVVCSIIVAFVCSDTGLIVESSQQGKEPVLWNEPQETMSGACNALLSE
jgi:hypothetical protein